MTDDELIAAAVAEVKGKGPFRKGQVVATPDDDIAMTIAGFECDGTVAVVKHGNVVKRWKVSEMFDANACCAAALRIKARLVRESN